MNCHEAQYRFSAWLDDEQTAEDRAALEQHLEACADCRAMADAVRLADVDLRRAFAPRRQAAANLAERVLADLNAPTLAPRDEAPAARQARRGWPLLAAAAAGFLLAALVFRPWQSHDAPLAAAAPPAAARLSLATGPVHVRAIDALDWLVCPVDEPIAEGARVKTAAGVRCELATATGCEVQLNASTEVCVRDAREIELSAGELWTSVRASQGPLTVTAPQGKVVARQGTLNIASGDKSAVVSVLEGSAALSDGDGERIAQAGQEIELVGGRVADSRPLQDPLLKTSWTNHLLAFRDPDDRELHRRINRMLAYLGEAKLRYLYEDEIRSLGEHAVLPLLRYLESPATDADAERRAIACRIAADLAPPRYIPELIELLADDDPNVRAQAARGLERLTGRDQGRTPDQWLSDSWTSCEPTHRAWQRWWQENRGRYPNPPPMQTTKRKET